MSKAFLIKYLDSTGSLCILPIQAANKEMAIVESGITSSEIITVSMDHLFILKQGMNKVELPIQEQAILLQNISSSRLAGVVPKDSFYELVDKKIIEKLDQVELKKCIQLSDYLSLLNIDPTVTTLIKAGEAKNSEVSALNEASRYLLDEAKSRQEISKATRSGKVQGGIGLLAIMFGTPAFGSLIQSMIDQRIPLKKNIFTEYMLFTYGNIPLMLTIYACVGLTVYVLFQLYKKKPYLKFFSLFYGMSKLKRAIFFCNMYRLLVPKGVTPPDLVDMSMENSQDFTLELYTELKRKLSEGQNLSKVITEEHWPKSMLSVLPNLEKMSHDIENITVILQSMVSSLGLELAQRHEKLGRFMASAGLISLMCVVIVLIVGFYLPMFGNAGSQLR